MQGGGKATVACSCAFVLLLCRFFSSILHLRARIASHIGASAHRKQSLNDSALSWTHRFASSIYKRRRLQNAWRLFGSRKGHKSDRGPSCVGSTTCDLSASCRDANPSTVVELRRKGSLTRLAQTLHSRVRKMRCLEDVRSAD